MFAYSSPTCLIDRLWTLYDICVDDAPPNSAYFQTEKMNCKKLLHKKLTNIFAKILFENWKFRSNFRQM